MSLTLSIPTPDAAMHPELPTRLAAVGRELVRALPRPTFLDRLCTITAEALGACSSCVMVRDARSGRFLPIARKSLARRSRLDAEPSPARGEEMARHLQHESVVEMTDDEHAALAPTRWLCIALRRGSRLAGIVLAGRRAARPFSADDRAVAESIGRLASLAVENARLASELERVNHIKADFVATMSHELRTPLNIILGYVSLLLEGDFGALSDDQSSALAHVDRNAHALLELVQGTLDLSRLERDALPVAVGQIVIGDLLAELACDVERLPHSDQVQLRWRADDDTPVVRSDLGKLRTVLKSLIANALKFTTTGSVDVHARACGSGVEISVADTGIGIPRGQFERIFEPFRQLGKTSTRAHGGVGMGLYVARRLVDLVGGSIAVTSRVGAGSTFRVWIPTVNHTADHGAALRAPRVGRKLAKDFGDRK